MSTRPDEAAPRREAGADPALDLDVAIVGLAGRFPGAPDVAAFWRNLRAGVESIRDLDEAELRAAGLDDAQLADPHLVRRAADLDDVERFDAGLFGFTPREAQLTDPQFRAFLEDAWTALEDAGWLTDGDARVGVFAGASPGSYLEYVARRDPRAAQALGEFQVALGNARDYLATQVAYRLDLRGPSLLVQTACSTSLVAVHLAVQSLLARECDLALAGGVSIGLPRGAGYLHADGDITSADGRVRAFDAAAAGVVKGDGSAVVVLRRLSDALASGDTIRAVIKGSAVNNDGRAKVGFTAPSVEGQAAVIAEALAAGGVDPATVDYVEAHGTGTPLGDPIEVAALARAFGPRASGAPRCALGSVKTNIGHLDAAAGVAGLVKAVLALGAREIPASLHFERPNPKLDLAGAGFFVNTALRPWQVNGHPRRAGVSSFGIGGTNAHVVLEEAPAAPQAAPSADPQVLVLSAATGAALAAAAEALARRLEQADAPALADAAFTLQVGRRRLPWRRSLVATDAAAAVAALRAPRAADARRDERRQAEVAFLFPGQGAQRAGMARALDRDLPVFRAALERCAGILAPHVGCDLRALLLADPADAAADGRLRHTALAQPALCAFELALAEQWRAWGVTPAAMAGHSLGEYVAACLAGVMSLEDALALVAERGRLMGGVAPGAMLAVHLPEDALAARLVDHPALALAVVNGPSACVAAGPEDAVARLEADLAPAGIACRRLHTSHAFHSAMMDPVLEAFAARVRAVRLRPPATPFVSNLTGTWITDAEATDPRYWVRHLRHTVRFADDLRTLLADDARVLLEVGPGQTLGSLARALAGEAVPSLPAQPGDDDARALRGAVGQLWCRGADPDWAALHDGRRRRVPLPTYPFERQRHWVDADSTAPHAAGAGTPAPGAKTLDVGAWFWVPSWRRARSAGAATEGATPWLVFDDGSPLADAVAVRAEARGARVLRVRPGAGDLERDGDGFALDPGRPDGVAALWRALAALDARPLRIAHLWCAGDLAPEASLERGFHTLLRLLSAMGQAGATRGVRLVAVTRGLCDVTGEAVRAAERATMLGPCLVAPQEMPGLACRLVDLGGAGDAEAARAIERELDDPGREPLVAWRGGHRWLPCHDRLRLAPPAGSPRPVRPGGTYLFTGGAGPFETAAARRLAAEGAGAIGFLGPGPDPATRDALVAAGAAVHAWDVDLAGAGEAIGALRARTGRVDAVLHTAGEIEGGLIALFDPEAVARVLAPRLAARRLAEALADGEELVLFSSAITATGVVGQVDYAAASAFLDALAPERSGGSGPRVRVIDWGMAHWDRWRASASAGAGLADQLRAIQGEIGITVEEGVDALWRVLAAGEERVVVSTQDLDEAVAQARESSVDDVLAGLGAGARHDGAGAGLESETERQVAAVWSDLLGVANIGRTDGFFDLGGNSLLAIQLAARLRRQFDIELSVATLFESADLAALAAAVDRAGEERRANDEIARLLDEIEALPDDEVRARLRGGREGEGA